MTGRGPFPMVAAALCVAAAARGIALPPEAVAAGARAAVTSTKKSLVALKRELGTFAASCAWWVTRRVVAGRPDPFGIVLASSSSRDRAADVDKGASAGVGFARDAIDADDGARLDAMPVAFRVADGVRAARLAKIERCKVTGSLDDDDGYGDEEYGDATGAEAATGRAEAPPPKRRRVGAADPPTSGSSSPARPGAARRSVWAPTAAASNPGAGGSTRAGSPGSTTTTRGVGSPSAPARRGSARTRRRRPPRRRGSAGVGTNGASVGGAPLGWTDVLIQQLLLAGVPERLVVEEDGLFPDVSVDQSTGAVKPVRPVRARSTAVGAAGRWGRDGGGGDRGASRPGAVARGELEGPAARRRGKKRCGTGGDDDDDDERATAARILAAREAVERADADAIAAIPDEDVAGLIRTEEEAAVVKAMAARRLVQFDADDYYKIIGRRTKTKATTGTKTVSSRS